MKRGQGWGVDLIIATTIFLSTLLIFFFYSLNSSGEGQDTLDNLLYEGEFISSTLLSDGYPVDWNENNVVTLGILSNGKINDTKLERLYNMANPVSNPIGYEKSKNLFRTKYEYFFNMSEPIDFGGEPIPEGGIGKAPPIPPLNPKSLVKTSRITNYKGSPRIMEVYVWE